LSESQTKVPIWRSITIEEWPGQPSPCLNYIVLRAERALA